jgi:hypothetical protein
MKTTSSTDLDGCAYREMVKAWPGFHISNLVSLTGGSVTHPYRATLSQENIFENFYKLGKC